MSTHHDMEITEERDSSLSVLRAAHQEASDALFKARLEGLNEAALCEAARMAQRAANALFAARLDQERSRPC